MKLFLLISILLVSSCSDTPLRTKQKPQNLFSFRKDSPSLKNDQVFCSETNSCLEGKCLPRGDGLNVCIRAGENGDICRKAKDCQGAYCSNRGDGIYICMGLGQEGDFCERDDMCQTGKCQRVGDVFKVCLK